MDEGPSDSQKIVTRGASPNSYSWNVTDSEGGKRRERDGRGGDGRRAFLVLADIVEFCDSMPSPCLNPRRVGVSTISKN